jgi:hypothetical protein
MKLLIYISLVAVNFLIAQHNLDKRSYTTQRLNSAPPQIDGVLNDLCWQDISFQSHFKQLNPSEGAAATEKTAFAITYNNDFLFIAFKNYDSRPDSIEALISRHDDIEQSDFIFISFDSYFDKRTAFGFGVNAAGVREDALFSNNGNHADESWNPVWHASSVITDSGWIAECKIPFSQLRFANKEKQRWGLNVYRNIFRKKEEVLWQFLPKDANGFVSLAGYLDGLENIPQPNRLELLPYLMSDFNSYEKEAGNPYKDGNDFNFEAGIDGKFGLTSNLTLDFTVNPDFGQVEADPSEVNLSAFESYFSEKRPFFVEGRNIFAYRLSPDGGMAVDQLFYSRRIGASPHYFPDEEDGFNYDYVQQPQFTRILGAVKLSGKTKNGASIGVLNALTPKETAALMKDGKESKVTVEPLTNYLISRVKQDYNDGNTTIGTILTATNRLIEDSHLNFLNKSAYTGGIDLNHEWDDKAYLLDFRLGGSYVKGKREAITALQKSSARYYQRPDAHYLTLDTNRTSLIGQGGSLTIGKIGRGHWRYGFSGSWRSPGIELNDVGFLRQSDRISEFIWVAYRQQNPQGIFRYYNVSFAQWNGWNYGGDKLYTGGNLRFSATFLNYWSTFVGINRDLKGYTNTLLRGGPLARYMGQWNFFGEIESDSRRDLVAEFDYGFFINDDDISLGYRTELELRYKLSNQLQAEISTFYRKGIENLQYITETDFNDSPRYIFGKIDKTTTGMFLRLNYSPTPNISIQYYGQPFISVGKFTNFKQISSPKSDGEKRYTAYKNRQIFYEDEAYGIDENFDGNADYYYDDPNYNYKEFLSNLVFRWEYTSGSILYLVWSQTRNNFENPGEFSLINDGSNLFDSIPNNVLLVKLNYWLNY